MMKRFILGLALVSLVVLAGCGGGGHSNSQAASSGGGLCHAFGGGASTVTTSPASTASFSNAGLAFDGDLSTFATLNTTGGTGTSSIQGNAQSGIVEPAGSVAGILFEGSINSNTEVAITTYLNGTEQDTGPAVTTSSSGSLMFYGVKTSKVYNQLKATLTLIDDGTSINIYELCAE